MPRQTTFARTGDVTPQWHTVDADGQILGRLATKVATILMGKHRPEYTPHVDCGDYVIITNAEKVLMTGRKLEHKVRTSWSGYPSGLTVRTFGSMMQKRPEFLVEEAVRRMLPKNRLGSRMLKKLKVYKGAAHPHAAQQPAPMEA